MSHPADAPSVVTQKAEAFESWLMREAPSDGAPVTRPPGRVRVSDKPAAR